MPVSRVLSAQAPVRSLALQPLAANFPGTNGDDVFTGGNSAEKIVGKGGNDSLSGGDGNDTITGDAGNDTLSGDAGSDKVSGGDGDDWIVGGKGDRLDGGLGYDTFEIIATATGETLSLNFANLPAGKVVVDGATLTGFEAGVLTTTDRVNIQTGALDLTLHASGVVRAGEGRLVAHGADGPDQFIGGAADDILAGGGDRDTLKGGAGDDLLLIDTVDNASDLADGGAGADTIIGGGSGDVIEGGKGVDRFEHEVVNKLSAYTVVGSKDKFTLDGMSVRHVETLKLVLGAGADKVTAGSLRLEAYGLRGNDTLTGGGADDLLCGGQGDDLIDGGKGVDTASFADVGVQAPATVDLRITGAQTTGSGDDTLKGIENLLGSMFADQLTGDGGGNRLEGGGGADTLDGGGGKDVLVGWHGAQLTGGSGADRFLIAPTGEQTADKATITIMDLTAVEIVDLSAVDANLSTTADDAFSFVESFSGEAGEAILTYRAGQDDTLLEADTDGDGAADLQVILEGGDWTGFLGFIL